ncbi:hypothetical protein GGI21_003981, partial [Coemansia aciculifera]
MPFVKDAPTSHTVVFRTGPHNALLLQVSPALDSTAASSIRVAASVGRNAHDAIRDLFERIRQMLPSSSPPEPSSDALCQSIPAHGTALTGGMGYCTWNTFYQQVSHDKVVSVLSDICRIGRTSDQPVPEWALIDDGWQTTTQDNNRGQLREIFANKDKFPGQLRQTVDKLAELGIRRVGVWHALWGYWGGIDPLGPLAQRYQLVKHRRKWCAAVGEELDVWLVSRADVAAFYDEFYQWLRAQGISFVKVDCQAAFETLCELNAANDDIYATYNAYYDAMESAALKHFGPGSVVYCMAQTPLLILRTLQRLGSSAAPSSQQRDVFRNSDDHFPDEPSSHGWHVYCNMANVLWSRQLQPRCSIDWDMFQSGGQESHIHAASRALSGGPIYITGTPASYARQDLATTVGYTSHSPLPSPPLINKNCLFADMTSIPGILVGSTSVADRDAVIVSVYNVFHKMVIAPVFLSQAFAESAPDSVGGSRYAIHQQSTDRVCICQALSDIYTLALQSLACDALTVAKMATFRSSDRSATLFATCLGDTSCYAGIGVVERNVFGVVQTSAPSTPLPRSGSPFSIGGGGQRQWTLRVRVSGRCSGISFVLQACESAAEASPLPLSVQSVRIQGLDSEDWEFLHEHGVLKVALHAA